MIGPSLVRVVQADTYNLVHAADLAVVASGTATLETALLERPMVIVYRMAPLTYALARLFVDVPFIGMPNLIAERRVVPELIQGAVTPDRIVHEVRRLLDSRQAYSVAQHGLREVRRRLGDGGAAERHGRPDSGHAGGKLTTRSRVLDHENLPSSAAVFASLSAQFFLALGCMVVFSVTSGALPFVVEHVFDDIFAAKNLDALRILPLIIIGVFVVPRAGQFRSQLSDGICRPAHC